MDPKKIREAALEISKVVKSNKTPTEKKTDIFIWNDPFEFETDTCIKLLETEGDFEKVFQLLSNLKINNLNYLFDRRVNAERFIEIIMKKSSKININSEDFYSNIMTFLKYDEFEPVKFAIENGLNIDYFCKRYCRLLNYVCGKSPSDLRAENLTKEYEEFLDYLLSKGANPNFVKGDYVAPFVRCLKNRNFVFARKIINASGFNVNEMYDEFNYYEICRDEETQKLLVEKGIKLRTYEEFLKVIHSNDRIMKEIVHEC